MNAVWEGISSGNERCIGGAHCLDVQEPFEFDLWHCLDLGRRENNNGKQ